MKWNLRFSPMPAIAAALMLMLAGCGPSTSDQSSSEKGGKPGQKTPSPSETPAGGEPEKVAASAEPLGLPPVPVPADNPMTPEKVELGKLLYFDKRVSSDGTVSCATCHDPAKGWTDNLATSAGIKDAEGHPQIGGRNAPTVINAAYATSQFWDGRAKDLEEQAVGPVGNPIEMGSSMSAVVEAFSEIPGYQERFQKVFGTGVTEKGFAQAIAAFERTVLSGNSAFDREELNEAQTKGHDLFMEHCDTCHLTPLFTNHRFYNAGVGMDKEKPDLGRFDVTEKDSDKGKFRVPTLRDIANTGPYFHDGSGATLEDAVALMADGGIENDNLSSNLKLVGEEGMTDEDKANLVEFLKALTGDVPVIEPPTEFPQ